MNLCKNYKLKNIWPWLSYIIMSVNSLQCSRIAFFQEKDVNINYTNFPSVQSIDFVKWVKRYADTSSVAHNIHLSRVDDQKTICNVFTFTPYIHTIYNLGFRFSVFCNFAAQWESSILGWSDLGMQSDHFITICCCTIWSLWQIFKFAVFNE